VSTKRKPPAFDAHEAQDAFDELDRAMRRCVPQLKAIEARERLGIAKDKRLLSEAYTTRQQLESAVWDVKTLFEVEARIDRERRT